MILGRRASAVVLTLSVLVGGIWAVASPVTTEAEIVPTPESLAPVPVREGVIMVNILEAERQDQAAILLTPSGKRIEKVSAGAAVFHLGEDRTPVCLQFDGRLSPDGKRLIAFQFPPISSEKRDHPGTWTQTHLWSFDLESKDGPRAPLLPDIKQPSQIYDSESGREVLFVPCVQRLSLAFSGDSRKCYVSEIDADLATEPVDASKPIPMKSWVYDFQTSKKTRLALPAGHAIVDASLDGKWLLTLLRKPNQPDPLAAFVVPLDTMLPRPLCAEPFYAMRLSPDGKSVLGILPRKEKENPRDAARLAVVCVADGSIRSIPLSHNEGPCRHACWSPDGKQIAYEWQEWVSESLRNAQDGDLATRMVPASRVSVADADGGHARVVLRCEPYRIIHGLDWK